MKVGIIGIGYWGKIILNTLSKHNFDISICDIQLDNKFNKYKTFNDYKKLDCDNVFISVPATKHFEICKYFIEKKVNIFCEKPLCTDSKEVEILYDLARQNGVKLFTDWIFTFNSQINRLKDDYDNGKFGNIRSVSMNRLNFGPERFDVNARWDLASHDISIIQYLFGKQPDNVEYVDYKRNKSSYKDDSVICLMDYGDFHVDIHASWFYRRKVRSCVFEFDKCYVKWDDSKGKLQYNWEDKIQKIDTNGKKPLDLSIEKFLYCDNEYLKQQEKLTKNITRVLEWK